MSNLTHQESNIIRTTVLEMKLDMVNKNIDELHYIRRSANSEKLPRAFNRYFIRLVNEQADLRNQIDNLRLNKIKRIAI